MNETLATGLKAAGLFVGGIVVDRLYIGGKNWLARRRAAKAAQAAA